MQQLAVKVNSVKSHRYDASQYTAGPAPETSCRCFALTARSLTTKTAAEAGM